MVVSATSVLWYFIIEPTAISGGESWSAVIVAGAYPAMDMLLLASIASIIFRRSEVNTRYSLRILSVGLLFYVVADIVYAWQVLQNSYVSGTWLDLLWTFSYFFVGLAALRQSRLELVEVESANKPSINRQVFLIPFVALGVSVAASLYAASTGDGAGPRTNGLVFGTALAVILTLTRQVITIRENALLLDDLNLASDQLRSNAKILEERVAERTKELESQKNRLRIAAQITKDSTSARDLESLLERSTRLILDQFMMYHVAIFLLDQKKEFAILTSSPTEAGRQMIANGHKLRVGETGIVGRVAAIGEPRIAFDVNQDDVHFNNPLLPDTRSEMALPLKVETRIVGVLDIQSSRVQAFNEDDIAVMQIIAEQLAIAIEHTQLLQQVEVNFRELEQAYGRSTRESWMSLAKSGLLRNTGYRFDNVRIQPITTTPDLGMEAIRSGQKVMRDDNGSGQSKQTQAAIPVKLRGQAIGVVTVKLKEGYSLNTINTIEQAVDRLAASLESARLFEEARSRADREQAIAQVSAAISSAGDFDTILRTTVEEIGKSLGDSEVSIQIISETGQA
jgi:GAF domain-containing protein